jgi:RHS repeat-associated protein
VGRSDASGTTQYLYGDPTDPQRLTAVRSATGVLSTLTYDDDGLVIGLQQGSSRYYVSCDQTGSPRVMIDGSGRVVKTMSYDSFGAITADSNPALVVPLGFAGGLADGVTGLLHFDARVYDPAAGRWTARDPELFDAGQVNLYEYVGNDPLNYRDADGVSGTKTLKNYTGPGSSDGGTTSQQAVDAAQQAVDTVGKVQSGASKVRKVADAAVENKDKGPLDALWSLCFGEAKGEAEDKVTHRTGDTANEYLQQAQQSKEQATENSKNLANPLSQMAQGMNNALSTGSSSAQSTAPSGR